MKRLSLFWFEYKLADLSVKKLIISLSEGQWFFKGTLGSFIPWSDYLNTSKKVLTWVKGCKMLIFNLPLSNGVHQHTTWAVPFVQNVLKKRLRQNFLKNRHFYGKMWTDKIQDPLFVPHKSYLVSRGPLANPIQTNLVYFIHKLLYTHFCYWYMHFIYM